MDKTTVIFRVWKDSKWKDTTGVIALFPEIPSDTQTDRYCSSYEHIGQHGGADPRLVINATRRALPADYADLKKELEGLGYDLIVKQRYTLRMRVIRESEWRKMMSKDLLKKTAEPTRWNVEYYIGDTYHGWHTIEKTITWNKEDDPTEKDLMDLFDYTSDNMAFAGVYSFNQIYDEESEDESED